MIFFISCPDALISQVSERKQSHNSKSAKVINFPRDGGATGDACRWLEPPELSLSHPVGTQMFEDFHALLALLRPVRLFSSQLEGRGPLKFSCLVHCQHF